MFGLHYEQLFAYQEGVSEMAAARIYEEEWANEEISPRHLSLVSSRPVVPLRTGPSITVRRAARERMLRRRRRALVTLALVATFVVLAWPGHAFGGVTGRGVPADQATSSLLSSGMVYVVEPGDTVTSIATHVNPWQPSVARQALIRELGSSVVVPGEHVLIP